MRNLVICFPYPILFERIIEKDEMGGACSTYGGEERRMKGLGGETSGKETTWKTQAWVGE